MDAERIRHIGSKEEKENKNLERKKPGSHHFDAVHCIHCDRITYQFHHNFILSCWWYISHSWSFGVFDARQTTWFVWLPGDIPKDCVPVSVYWNVSHPNELSDFFSLVVLNIRFLFALHFVHAAKWQLTWTFSSLRELAWGHRNLYKNLHPYLLPTNSCNLLLAYLFPHLTFVWNTQKKRTNFQYSSVIAVKNLVKNAMIRFLTIGQINE